MGYSSRVSCSSLFKTLRILPLTSQYILQLMLFVAKNKHFFILNSQNHTKGTRQLNNLYHPITNLTVYQKGAHYMGIRIFNNLPPYIKEISYNIEKFENSLKQFLHIHSIYSLEFPSIQILYKLKMFSQPLLYQSVNMCNLCSMLYYYKC